MEVIVVTIIAGLLAALITTVVVRGIFSAKVSSCASNLNQMSHAIELYAQDHDDTWPPYCFVNIASDPVNGARKFKAAIHGYTKSDDLFYCPLDSKTQVKTRVEETSYNENLLMLFQSPRIPGPELAVAFRPSTVTNPSGCASLYDTWTYSVPGDRTSRFVSSHLDRSNALFLDGHVDSMNIYNGTQLNWKGTCEGPIVKGKPPGE